jgi:hypothetical protein
MKEWLLYPAIASAATLVLRFCDWPRMGGAAFAVFVGWPLLGTLITADDDLPGGWSNPDGTIPPPWRTGVFWGRLSMGFSISAFVAALDAGLRTGAGVEFAIAGSAARVLAFAFLRQPLR